MSAPKTATKTPPTPPPPAPRVRIRYPGTWPLRFGDLATGGVIHDVDADLADRLLQRGFVLAEEPVTPPAPLTPPVED